MINGISTQSDNRPDTWTVNKLKSGKLEVTYSADITEDEHASENGTVTSYSYITWSNTITADSYDDFVAALVALKYTVPNEIALLKKAETDEERLVWEEYVTDCKTFAKSYLGIAD